MACDVSPVAMFLLLDAFYTFECYTFSESYGTKEHSGNQILMWWVEIKPPGILSSLCTQTGPWSDTFSYNKKEFTRGLLFGYGLCMAIYEKRTWLEAKRACGCCTTFVTVGADFFLLLLFVTVGADIQLVLQHQRLGLPSADSRSPSLGQNPSQECAPRGFSGRLLASYHWRFSKSADLHLLTNLTCWPDHFPHCSWPCGTFLTHRGTPASLLCSLLPKISKM